MIPKVLILKEFCFIVCWRRVQTRLRLASTHQVTQNVLELLTLLPGHINHALYAQVWFGLVLRNARDRNQDWQAFYQLNHTPSP